jgi:hypothetical protein
VPKIVYTPRTFSAESRALITQANAIIVAYQAQGYNLTLRQLYYQFVSRDLLSNNLQSYKRLGSVINDARLAGEIDWSAIEDRTRNLHALPAWGQPADIIKACATQFRIDKWKTQPHRVEVWIEKEALAGVFERVCDDLQVPFFSCRGYTSQSEMWVAGQRLKAIVDAGQQPVILHFGDHDPSGMDMTRDIIDRLTLFMGADVDLKRLALNMDQVREYGPPPNPAKITDSRAASYIFVHGNESWELDALEPDVLAGLVRDYVEAVRDDGLWREAVERENEHRRLLGQASTQWDRLTMEL